MWLVTMAFAQVLVLGDGPVKPPPFIPEPESVVEKRRGADDSPQREPQPQPQPDETPDPETCARRLCYRRRRRNRTLAPPPVRIRLPSPS